MTPPPRRTIQFFVSPTSGFLTSCGPLTPGYTGGYNHFALSELTFPIYKRVFHADYRGKETQILQNLEEVVLR